MKIVIDQNFPYDIVDETDIEIFLVTEMKVISS